MDKTRTAALSTTPATSTDTEKAQTDTEMTSTSNYNGTPEKSSEIVCDNDEEVP